MTTASGGGPVDRRRVGPEGPRTVSRGAWLARAVAVGSALGACDSAAPELHAPAEAESDAGKGRAGQRDEALPEAGVQCPGACERDFGACLRAVEGSVRECLTRAGHAHGACTTAGVGQAELCRQSYEACPP